MAENFIFDGSLETVDPELKQLLQAEDDRQDSRIILIASESAAPTAVRTAVSSTFGNIYAEGYPREESRRQRQNDILDVELELAHYRRYSDPRYYKGVEYADILEALARRRAAELFAANGISADNLYVNVQPLSGGPANSAVYTALLQPGDTIMGLNLNDGGHLSHGTKINRSGKHYNGIAYFVDPQTELLNYDAIEQQALENKPNIIVAGFSAYPMIVDWQRFRQIADKVGAYLLADISHISGLVAAGVHPSPVGIADVIMTTTHKSLCGPRGAMIITHRKDLSSKIDRAVFPGEQGGPHLNSIAALAVALKLAKTEQFQQLQQRIVQNAQHFAKALQAHGFRVVAGGSETHLLLVDTKSISHDGVHLSGDMAARILDLAGIVVNRNTIPGDVGALNPTGLRLGTVWVSQLGFAEAEIEQLAEAIATVLKGCKPFTYVNLGNKTQLRAKVDFAALQKGRQLVRQLRQLPQRPSTETVVQLRGQAATALLNHALSSDVLGLAVGQGQASHIYGPGIDHNVTLFRLADDRYQLQTDDAATAVHLHDWLQALSDGYVQFSDLHAKLDGPVAVQLVAETASLPINDSPAILANKPFFVGQPAPTNAAPLPTFSWQEPSDPPLKRTSLYDTHVALDGRIVPFAGYEMPVRYQTSVGEEHTAVRTAAGLFDATHMGVFEASGPYVVDFLNVLLSNDVTHLAVGESHYTYLLQPDGTVLDDLLVYRLADDRFMLVVNAGNNDKDWAWLTAVNEKRVQIDATRPWITIQHPVQLRDLRDPQWGDDCRVDVPLQGPKSLDILLALADPESQKRIKKLAWARLTPATIGGLDVIVSRTGYTGERIAYELFVHPDKAPELWQLLLKTGEPWRIKPCGLAARDSLRTEAGLPLYGHELMGDLGLNPADAGFGSYVKLWKPFFVGRDAFIQHEAERKSVVVRFRMNEKGVRRPESGDPVLDGRGKVIGLVTSCSLDSEGYLLGQAYLPISFRKPDTPLWIYQLGGGKRQIPLPQALKVGAKLPIPDAATVLTRFPSKKK